MFSLVHKILNTVKMYRFFASGRKLSVICKIYSRNIPTIYTGNWRSHNQMWRGLAIGCFPFSDVRKSAQTAFYLSWHSTKTKRYLYQLVSPNGKHPLYDWSQKETFLLRGQNLDTFFLRHL